MVNVVRRDAQHLHGLEVVEAIEQEYSNVVPHQPAVKHEGSGRTVSTSRIKWCPRMNAVDIRALVVRIDSLTIQWSTGRCGRRLAH